MEAVILQHSQFFDQLVDLIPARFYHGEGEDRLHLKSMKKAQRAALKPELKAKAKENKRRKLDPDAPATALEVQQQQNTAQAGAAPDKQPAGGLSANHTAPAALGSAALSRDELKAKLQQKIQALRSQKRKEREEVASQAREWRQKKLGQGAAQQADADAQDAAGKPGQGKKRKAPGDAPAPQQGDRPSAHGNNRPNGAAHTAHDTADPSAHTGTKDRQGHKQQQQQQRHQQGGAGRQQHGSAANGTAGNDIQFARVEFDDTKAHGKRFNKKPTKEQLLAAAEAKRAELTAAGNTEEGQVKAIHDAWRTAMARAGGEKVLDDPKLLKRSLKKEAKRKEKSAKAWQERKAAQQDQQDRKQQRRQDNLQSRVDTKIANKKAKREKKLLRAGFEGRKTGFIGSAKKTGGGAGAGGGAKAS